MLVGQKVKLVPLEKFDLVQTQIWANDISLNENILRVLPVTQDHQEKWYRKIVEDRTKIVFAIKNLKDDEHIGNTGFYNIDWVHRRTEFWILIGEKSYWSEGLGTECISLMLNYGFNRLNMNKIYLYVSENNTRAVNLYKKMNFVDDGRLKQHYFIDGRYIDVLVMSILRMEFDCEK